MTLRGSRIVHFVLPLFVLALALATANRPARAGTADTAEERARVTYPTLHVTAAVSGLEIPWDVKQLPAGHLIFTQRDTKQLFVKDGSGVHEVTFPNASVWVSGETGLMSLAIDPEFGHKNRRFYMCHGRTTAGGHDIAVTAWRLSRDRDSATFIRTLLGGIQITTGRHGGCRLLIRPSGKLWVGTGDSAVGTNPQNLHSLNGKVLGLDYRTGNPWPTNPWVDAANVKKRYIVNYGHRNIQGLALREDGTIWSVEHGPDRDDEVNIVVEGGNYGWDPVPADPGDPSYNEAVPMTDLTKFPDAITARWSSGFPTVATSGAAFVRGPQWGGYDGMLAVACLKESQVIFMGFDADGHLVRTRVPVALQQDGRLRSVTRAHNGDLLITTSNGVDDRIIRVHPGG